MPDRAPNRDIAAVLVDDTVAHCQAQAGALARIFGGEERLEDMFPRFLVDPDPGVADRQGYISARQQPDILAYSVLVEHDILRLDRQFAADGHGVAGVDG